MKLPRLSNPTKIATALSLSLCASAGHAQTLSEIDLGFRIMANRQQGNCITCHQISALRESKFIDGATGKHGDFGPSLDGVSTRYTTAQLRQWVLDARKLKPNTLMPPFGTLEGTSQASPPRPMLSAEEIDQVTAALASLR
jgi:sulfur-oxidizing protein SoxX